MTGNEENREQKAESGNLEGPPVIDNERCGRIVHAMTLIVGSSHSIQPFSGAELLQIASGYLACTIRQMCGGAETLAEPENVQQGVKAVLFKQAIDLATVMVFGPTAEVEFENADSKRLDWLEKNGALVQESLALDAPPVEIRTLDPESRQWVLSGNGRTIRAAIDAAMKHDEKQDHGSAKPRRPWMKGTLHQCRICGCTDDDCTGCIAKTGQPCHWVEPDLCSACQDRPMILTPEGGAKP